MGAQPIDHMILLTESSTKNTRNFLEIMDDMKKEGWKGKAKCIDNISMRTKIFNQNQCCLFQIQGEYNDGRKPLPFTYYQPIYVYINDEKRGKAHKEIISHLDKKYSKTYLC